MVDVALLNLPANKEQLKTYAGAFMLSDNIFHKALNHITKAKILDAVRYLRSWIITNFYI